METKHTKGQWYFTTDGIFDSSGDQLASVLQSDEVYFKSRGENIANAKLMAASPELLEALIKAKEMLTKNGLPGSIICDRAIEKAIK